MKFKRVVSDFGKLSFVISEGTKFVDSYGHELILFHYREIRKWYLIDEYTGLNVAYGNTKKECINYYIQRNEAKYDSLLKRGYNKSQKRVHEMLEGDEQ